VSGLDYAQIIIVEDCFVFRRNDEFGHDLCLHRENR
jgi:hypothetical protein